MYGRLALFILDNVKLAKFVDLLSVCESTADVCLAMRCLADGKGRIDNILMTHEFCKTLLPWLKFSTTETAIYKALYRNA